MPERKDQEPEDTEEAERARRAHVEDLVDQALKDSFPASDPTAVSIPRKRPPQK